MSRRSDSHARPAEAADQPGLLALIALVLLMLLPCASWAEAAELRVPLRERETLVLQAPADWLTQIRRSRPDLPPTVALSSPQALGFKVLVTPLWPPPGSAAVTPEALRRQVEGSAQKAASRSVEGELRLHEFTAPGRSGYYFSATDRDAGPNGYTHLTQGAIGYEGLLVMFTILANGQADAVVSQAMAALRAMKLERAPGAP